MVVLIENWSVLVQLRIVPRRAINHHRILSCWLLRRFDLDVKGFGLTKDYEVDVRAVGAEQDVGVVNYETSIFDRPPGLGFFSFSGAHWDILLSPRPTKFFLRHLGIRLALPPSMPCFPHPNWAFRLAERQVGSLLPRLARRHVEAHGFYLAEGT